MSHLTLIAQNENGVRLLFMRPGGEHREHVVECANRAVRDLVFSRLQAYLREMLQSAKLHYRDINLALVFSCALSSELCQLLFQDWDHPWNNEQYAAFIQEMQKEKDLRLQQLAEEKVPFVRVSPTSSLLSCLLAGG